MSTEIKTIHLLLVEPSSNHAEAIVNSLRNRGYAVRATQVLSPEELDSILEKQVSDLLLAVSDFEELTAKQAIEQISQFGRDIPVIVMLDELDEEKILEALVHGASNVTSHTNLDIISILVEHEFGNLEFRRNKTQSELALQASEKRCNLLLDSSQDAIAYIHDGMHVYANKAYLELFAYSDQDEIMCIPVLDTIAKDNQNDFKQHLKEVGSTSEQHSFSFFGARSDMSQFEAIMSLSSAHFDGENCTQVLIRQATDNSELEEKLKEISSLDTLTDLYNKVYFEEQLEIARQAGLEKSSTYNLLYIEYDQHEQLKSEYGIAGIEKITQETAKWLSDKVDETQVLARLTDHSFGLLLEDKTNQLAKKLAEQLCNEIKPHLFDIDGHTIKLTLSIGICPIGDKSSEVDQLITNAHSAASRLEKGDGFKVFNKAFQNLSDDVDPVIVDKIQDAIESDRIELLYQPIVKLHGEERPLYQALLKLSDEEGNVINSSKVFSVAKLVGLGVKLDKWIIAETLRTIKASDSQNESRIFINLSSSSLIDETMLAYIYKTVAAAKIDKERLVFQVDETDALNHLKRVIAFTANLQEKGILCCLTHFGSSPDQITLLDQLQVKYVKISDSVSTDLHLKAESMAHVQHLIDEIHSRDKQSIIPRVEEAAMLAALWPMNVKYIQGYYLQRPSSKMEYDFSSSGF